MKQKHERTFEVELRDLYPNLDHWTYATVFYEPEHLGSGEIELIEDEFGKNVRLADLSPFDRERVEKHLILNLAADAQEVWREGKPWH